LSAGWIFLPFLQLVTVHGHTMALKVGATAVLLCW